MSRNLERSPSWYINRSCKSKHSLAFSRWLSHGCGQLLFQLQECIETELWWARHEAEVLYVW